MVVIMGVVIQNGNMNKIKGIKTKASWHEKTFRKV
jgi:hypothetical protein